MAEYIFITLKDFINWLIKNKGKDLGFTLDIKEELETLSPSLWYGAMIDNKFDGGDFFIGEYGIGIIFEGSREDSPTYSNYLKLMQEFFKDEGNVNINENSLICVYSEDFKKGDD